MRGRNRLIPFSTNALGGSTSLSVSDGEAGEKRHGGDTQACGCLMIERNHDQLLIQLVVASGSFGCQPRRSALLHIMSGVSCHRWGWARPTVAPWHGFGVLICQRMRMGCR